MTKIKLCGMLEPKDVLTANELQPDYVGFILAPNLRRTRSREQVRAMRSLLREEIKAVGVYIDEPIEQVAKDVTTGLIDVVQLHGKEDNSYIEELRTKVSCPIFKAFKITCSEDIKKANKSAADVVLLDNGTGTGKTFDHSLIDGIERAFILAGGLGPENVAAAIHAYQPLGVDTSSALETEGKKDPAKMAAFVKAVREA